ncbi:hypothetical protein WAI453_004073 [Rhynchosporium graminicola]
MSVRPITGKDTDYESIKMLGSGGFGSVSKVRRVADGKVTRTPVVVFYLYHSIVSLYPPGQIIACKDIDCLIESAWIRLAAREVATWANAGSERRYTAVFSQDCSWNSTIMHVQLYTDCYDGGDV